MENKVIYTVSSDFARPSTCNMYGFVDSVTAAGIAGWIVDLENSSSLITATIAGIPIATGKLDVWRPDISKLTGHPGSCGFSLAWEAEGLKKLALSNVEYYPLLFSYRDLSFVFANLPNISGSELEKIAASLADEPPVHELVADNGAKSEMALAEIKIIAFYCQRYYPASENAEPVGAVFSDWERVVQARPQYVGHEQPNIPGELGFCNPLSASDRIRQANLAKEYGLYGFCYECFWQNGQTVLDAPLRDMLSSGEPDFPFCICKANWPDDLQKEQGAGKGEINDLAFIEDIIPFLSDPRYIRAGNAPLILVNKDALSQDVIGTLSEWRRIGREQGFENLFICLVGRLEDTDFQKDGFDAVIMLPQFPPRLEGDACPQVSDNFKGRIGKYPDLAIQAIKRKKAGLPELPLVLTSWDDSPCKNGQAQILHDASPENYGLWLRAALDEAATLPQDMRFVFVKSWNDWLNGACLEPDRRSGRARLTATLKARSRQGGWQELLKYARALPELSASTKDKLLDDLQAHLAKLQYQVDWYDRLYGKLAGAKNISIFRPDAPYAVQGISFSSGGLLTIEQIGAHDKPEKLKVTRNKRFIFSGWGFSQATSLTSSSPSFLALFHPEKELILYHAYISERQARPDVAKRHQQLPREKTHFSGFRQMCDLSSVQAGSYRLGLVSISPEGACRIISDVIVEVDDSTERGIPEGSAS